jgi:hypothetical protein
MPLTGLYSGTPSSTDTAVALPAVNKPMLRIVPVNAALSTDVTSLRFITFLLQINLVRIFCALDMKVK